MNFIEAAKISDAVRRKDCPRHVGSSGNGWISARFAFNQGKNIAVIYGLDYKQIVLLTWDDLMADDWEAYIAMEKL